ncbi:MAG: hypothetical protein ACI81Y_001408, partial [Glaciecola sp.]
SYAQSNAIDKYFEKYNSEDSFTKVNMSSKAFELMAKIECDDAEINEITDMASQISQLCVLVDNERPTAKADYKRDLRNIENDYEELMSFSDKEGEFKFFIDESRGIVKELVIFGANDSTLAIVSLTGSMDLKKIGKISSRISTQTMDIMKKSHEVDNVMVYPNPVNEGASITIDTHEGNSDVKVDIYDSSGKLVKTDKHYKSGQQFSTSGLTSGQYVVHVIGDGLTIKKKFIIQ